MKFCIPNSHIESITINILLKIMLSELVNRGWLLVQLTDIYLLSSEVSQALNISKIFIK